MARSENQIQRSDEQYREKWLLETLPCNYTVIILFTVLI